MERGFIPRIFFPLLLLPSLALASDLELLQRSDVAAHAPASFRLRSKITTGVPPKRETLEIEVYQRGRERVLVRFLDPKQRGKFLLSLDGQSWFISPGAKKPVNVGQGHRLRGAASLDTILGLRYSEDYTIAAARHETQDGREVVIFDLAARSKNAPYPKVRSTVDVKSARPIQIEHRLPSGKLASLVLFESWTKDGRPLRLSVKDPLRPNQPTIVEMPELEPRALPEELFSLESSSARDALAP